jgi:DNA-binding Xre family transcriptional regulator
MVNSAKEQGEIIVRSRLKHLIADLETKRGRRIQQKDIAEATGLRDATISRWMSPEPFTKIDVKVAGELCKFLECELGDLLYIDHSAQAS